MEERVKLINRYLTGWGSYFGLAETPSTLERIDSWLRRRLRQVRWTEWKRPKARRHNLIVLGSSPHDARRWAVNGHFKVPTYGQVKDAIRRQGGGSPTTQP